MIEIVRITTPEVPVEESAWTVHRAETFDDAAKVMRERFIHAVVMDDSLAGDFIKRLYGYYQYPFPRERLFSIRSQDRAWCEPARVAAVLEQPWQASLQAYFDAHPAIAASAWLDFQLGDPPRLDEVWLTRSMIDEAPDVRTSAWHAVANLAHEGRPTGPALAHLIGAMTPDLYLTNHARSFVRHGDSAVKLRPFAEWIAKCPLLGIRKMAWRLVEDLNLHEGRVVAPTPLTPFEPLTSAMGEWSSSEAPTLSPTLGDTLEPTLTEPPPGLPCRACGGSDVGQTCSSVLQDYRDGMIDDVGLQVELRCRTCQAYSRYFCSYGRG